MIISKIIKFHLQFHPKIIIISTYCGLFSGFSLEYQKKKNYIIRNEKDIMKNLIKYSMIGMMAGVLYPITIFNFFKKIK